MKTNQAGLDLIKSFEGLKLSPYKDSVGVATIGIGSTYYEDGTHVQMSDSAITEERALQLLANTLAKTFEPGVTSCTSSVSVTDNQFSALVCFAYNVGLGNLKSSTLLKKLLAGDVAGAADQFLVWDKAGGQVLAGLLRRRTAERALFLSGAASAAAPAPSAPSSGSQLPDGPSDQEMSDALDDAAKNS